MCNIADKVAEASPVQVSYAEDFFCKALSGKLLLVIDMGITQFAGNPMLFEKSLKLLASLSAFPNFGHILGDDSKAQRYADIIRDIFASGVSSTVV